jgi:endo-1,4-beta-D-glucanase Y
VSSTGGKTGTGGVTSTGGTSATGGASNTGGVSNGGAGGSSGAGGGGAGGGGAGGGGAGGSGTSTGGTTGTGGSSGSGGGAGMCASAFFSADAAAKKATEYASWKTSFVQECTADKSAVVKNGGGVVSEGIGYGMLLATNNDDQPLFDKLWKFYTDHYDKNGLMNWSMDACTAPGNNNANAATDGDLDAAMGLVLADKKWGGYTSKAQELIGKIKKFETDTCSNGMVLLRPGDNWGGCTDSATKGKTNPSYFAPGYYRVFATVDTANAAFWKQLATDSYTLLAKYQTAMNGLVPEWGFSDGSIESSTYDYNACRTPWRIAMDYMWFCTAEAKTVLQNFSTFIDGKGGVAKTGYANNSAFVGAFADTGIAISQAKIDSYVKDWMGDTTMDDTPYFQGTLRRLYLLVAGGQFLSGQ